MANLPPRPPEYDERHHRHTLDARHYPPTLSRAAPMRYHFDRRDDRDSRSRPEGDVYVPPREYGRSYVPPGHDRHNEERYRDHRHETDHRRDEDARQQWYGPDKRESNYPGDRDSRSRDREQPRGAEPRRRGWERGSGSWIASNDRDRRQVYEKDMDGDRVTGRRRDGEWSPNSRRDPRLRRDSGSPPRRTGAHAYSDHPSDSRRPSHHQLRHRSPSHHSRSRSTARSDSRAASRPPKRIRLGNHSISNSPRSPASHDPPHDPPPYVSANDPQRPHGTSHRFPRASRSQSPRPCVKNEDQPDTAFTIPTPSVSSLGEKPAETQSPTPPRSPSPIQPEAAEDAQAPPEQTPKDKGKLKEKTSTDKGDLDVKIRDDSPSPPIHPRSTPASARLHRRSRSPPRGPRNYLKTPTAPASFYHFNAATKDWPRRNNTMSEGPATPVEAEPKPVIEPGPPMPPAVTLPVIPVYQTKPSLTPELDAEIVRIQAHRAHLVSDYVHVAKATRRALHELELATIDLRAAENRRKVADSQVEKARAGVLGIDAMQVS